MQRPEPEYPSSRISIDADDANLLELIANKLNMTLVDAANNAVRRYIKSHLLETGDYITKEICDFAVGGPKP